MHQQDGLSVLRMGTNPESMSAVFDDLFRRVADYDMQNSDSREKLEQDWKWFQHNTTAAIINGMAFSAEKSLGDILLGLDQAADKVEKSYIVDDMPLADRMAVWADSMAFVIRMFLNTDTARLLGRLQGEDKNHCRQLLHLAYEDASVLNSNNVELLPVPLNNLDTFNDAVEGLRMNGFLNVYPDKCVGLSFAARAVAIALKPVVKELEGSQP